MTLAVRWITLGSRRDRSCGPLVLRFLFTLALCWLLLPASTSTAAAQQTGVITPGAKLALLADKFSFTEGPAADAQGNVFFTDQPNNKIYKWSTDGKLSVFHDSPGRANGLYFDKSGNLYACADLNNELWMINPSGQATVLVKDFEGKKLNGPNDLWIDPKGGIYFTDPFYKRDYWTRGPMEQDGQHVYYLSPDRKKVARVTSDLQQPNGLIGTPDGKRLYVADIQARKTYVYSIGPDGTLSDKKLFANMGSDGMTMDEEENIYVVGKGVTVFNVRGEQIDHIDVPKGWTANVTFGGKDRTTLFITAMDSLYSIQTRVRGVR
jgi:gluconolactonase